MNKNSFDPSLGYRGTVTVSAGALKRTPECFRDQSRYYHRACSLDEVVSDERSPKSSEVLLWVFEPQRDMSFLGMLSLVADDWRVSHLPWILESVVNTTLIEALVEKQEANLSQGLLTLTGPSNFFFVLGNKGEVVPLGFCRAFVPKERKWQWDVGVYAPDDPEMWFPGIRFFLAEGISQGIPPL